jgi:hypothetical protein
MAFVIQPSEVNAFLASLPSAAYRGLASDGLKNWFFPASNEPSWLLKDAKALSPNEIMERGHPNDGNLRMTSSSDRGK